MEHRCRRTNNESCTRSTWPKISAKIWLELICPRWSSTVTTIALFPFQWQGSEPPRSSKGAQLVVIKGGPHCVTWTKAGEMKAALLNFLNKRRGHLIGTELFERAPKERSGIANDRSQASKDRMF